MILSSVNLSATTAKPSLIEDIDFLLKTDSTQYPLADKLRNINLAYYDVVTDILSYQSNWEWDSTNKTDFPIGTTDLVASQRDYALPSDFLKLLRLEVLDSAGNYQKLTQIDEQQIAQGLETFMSGDGMPKYYREVGNSVEIYPKASATSTTLTAGLKCYYTRAHTEFTNADAAVAPGFVANFHRVLSLMAAYDFASTQLTSNSNLITALKQRIDAMREDIKKFYSSRNREVRPRLGVKPRNYD